MVMMMMMIIIIIIIIIIKVQRIKSKQLDHWQYQYIDIVLESLTGTKKNCKN